MKHCLLVLLLCLGGRQGWAEDADEPTAAINGGFSLVMDAIHAGSDGWLANLDASGWIESDLGECLGADDWYFFVNPSLVWGAEEAWQWKPRLYQAWLKWDGSDRFNVLGGLVDLNWHFHSLPSAAPFARLPARTAGEFSPSSIGLLDLYPLSSPAMRVEWLPVTHVYVQAALGWLEQDHQVHGYELLRSSPANERWIVMGEAGWRDEGEDETGWRHRMFGLGGWTLPGAGTSWGVYAFADARLWSESGMDDGQGLSGFLSISAAQTGDFERAFRLATGLAFEGLIDGRDGDLTAVAMIIERQRIPGAGDHDRSAFELLHRVPLNEHFWVQASIQWQGQSASGSQGEWRSGLRVGWDY